MSSPSADPATISYTPGVTGTLTTINSSGVIKAINGSSSTSKQTENLTFSKVSGSSKVDVSSAGVISLKYGYRCYRSN